MDLAVMMILVFLWYKDEEQSTRYTTMRRNRETMAAKLFTSVMAMGRDEMMGKRCDAMLIATTRSVQCHNYPLDYSFDRELSNDETKRGPASLLDSLG